MIHKLQQYLKQKSMILYQDEQRNKFNNKCSKKNNGNEMAYETMSNTEDSKTMIVGNSTCAVAAENTWRSDNRNVTDADFEEATIEINVSVYN